MSTDGKSVAIDAERKAVAGSNAKSLATRLELREYGKSLRDACPRESHAVWKAASDRPDPNQLLEESSKDRIQDLIPIRYGRMLQSPFAFYRGTALNMAADLATTPTSGPRVQACGDSHLCNFGAYATPERRVIFDINDLDETLPAPWEWDVKRLAASMVLASRHNGHSEAEARDAAVSCVRSYREHMAEYGKMRVLDVWYSSIEVESLIDAIRDKDVQKQARKRLEKARERSSLTHDFPALATTAGGSPKIKDSPPLIFHPSETDGEAFAAVVEKSFAAYRETLPQERRRLLDRYQLMDIAMKVVGVGSVGTICGIILLMASEKDPLFLQLKQANASVLEPYAGRSLYANHGHRIVVGHHLMQSASDLFLGWTEGRFGRNFYIRQLKDMKIKPLVELFTAGLMSQFGKACGWVLARSHARSGEPAAISGYLGKGDALDEAIGDFAVAYADQAEQDHATFAKAVRSGRFEVLIEEP